MRAAALLAFADFVVAVGAEEQFVLVTGKELARVSLIAACNPLIQDAVITGHDRPEVGALVWVNQAAVRSLGLDESAVRARLQLALAGLRLGSSGSKAPSRLLVLDLPPSIDEGEITDKGYINQRAVLDRRAMHVEHLHAGGSGVIWAE